MANNAIINSSESDFWGRGAPSATVYSSPLWAPCLLVCTQKSTVRAPVNTVRLITLFKLAVLFCESKAQMIRPAIGGCRLFPFLLLSFLLLSTHSLHQSFLCVLHPYPILASVCNMSNTPLEWPVCQVSFGLGLFLDILSVHSFGCLCSFYRIFPAFSLRQGS